MNLNPYLTEKMALTTFPCSFCHDYIEIGDSYFIIAGDKSKVYCEDCVEDELLVYVKS